MGSGVGGGKGASATSAEPGTSLCYRGIHTSVFSQVQ